MKQVMLVEFGDLLRHAETLGFTWNGAHDILVKDDVPPMAEMKTKEICKGEGELYGWSEASKRIVDSFMEKNSLKEFTLA